LGGKKNNLCDEKNGKTRYLDIQIKARSQDAKNAGTFAVLDIPNPRKDYYYIFYSEAVETYWIVPSLELVREANRNKTGKNAGKYSIRFCNRSTGGPRTRPRFDKYKNAFNLLN
jgi:hypothetical protein